MAEERPEGMSEQDWSNFQIRYRPQGQQPAPGAPAGTGAAPGATPGVPGVVAPALKNPSPAPTPAFQPSPAPQIGLGNTVDGQQPQGGYGAKPTGPNGNIQRPDDGSDQAAWVAGEARLGQRVTAPGLTDARTLATGGAAPGQPSPQQTPAQQQQAMLRTSIMGLLGQNVNAASVQDADIAPQSQAFAAAQERYGAQRRAEAVHQAARGGYSNSGGLDQRLDSIAQNTAQTVGANDAALVGQKLESRRQQLTTAIQAASQMGMADEANNLSRQLANLDASIQTRGQDITREQTGLQRDLGNLDASTRIYLGDLNAQLQREGYSTQERLARMETEARKYGIDVQGRLGELDTALRSQLGNRQIDLGYDQLGVEVGDIQRQMNRDAVLAALGG